MAWRSSVVAALLVAAAAHGQVSDRGVPESVQLVRDVVYGEAPAAGGRTVELTLDAAFPRQSGGEALPVVVYVHGGGWSGGSKEIGLGWTVDFAEGGYFAVTINYRLSGDAPFPAAVHDCKAAVRFLRAHAAELSIDPQRIGLWGHSAGGHLSALVGASGNDWKLEGEVEPTGVSAEVRCVASVSGPVDLTKFRGPRARSVLAPWLGQEPAEYEANARAASPLTYLDARDPPVLIVHGTADRLVPLEQAELFKEALERAGVPFEYVPVPEGGHNLARRDVSRKIAAFFDRHLGGSAAAVIERREASPD